MKKILGIIVLAIIALIIGMVCNNAHTENIRKQEIKTLLQKPKAHGADQTENKANESSNVYKEASSNTQENTAGNSLNSNKNEDSYYLVTNDYDDNKQSQKADKSIDFISGINEDSNNAYNISSSNNDNDSDADLLAHLIESEAGDEPYEGKLAVASVVLNRTRMDGESISGVIFSKDQFDGVDTNNFKTSPSNDSIMAAKEVLSGTNVVPDAYYFADLNLCSPDFAKLNTFVIRIGNHWFFKK